MTTQIFRLKNESLKEHLKQLKTHVYFKVLFRLRKQRVAIASFSSLCFCRLECGTLGGLFLQVTFLVKKMDKIHILRYKRSALPLSYKA